MSEDTLRFRPSPKQALELRRAFGRFGTGVTVVTTHTRNGPLGMTANSFSSVSLDPPLVLWSPAVASLRHDAFVQASDFCVHVLHADQRAIADHFARDGGGFDQLDWTASASGAPVLSGCLAVFHCRAHAVHPAGDHTLILGEVSEVEMHPEDAPGLLFEQGRFGQFNPGQ